jgi:hypothetical protein
LFRPTTSRILLPAVAILAAWTSYGCAAAFGPGYTIEKQRVEVSYTREAENRVSVRASYELKNTGTKPLEVIDFRPPDPLTFEAKDLHMEWRGKSFAVTAPRRGSSDTEVHVPLNGSWAVGESGEFVLSYELAVTSDLESANPNSGAAFFLPTNGWLPSLLPPEHRAFATGGAPPKKWDLVVSVPDGYHVHASGEARSADKHGARGMHFEQQPQTNLNPYVVAGPYAEQQLHTHAGTVIIWTGNPVSADRANKFANRVASDAAFYAAEFGSADPKSRTINLIECPSGAGASITPDKLWFPGPNCLFLPHTVVVPPGFLNAEMSDDKMTSVDLQLAVGWFYFSAMPKDSDTLFPIAALSDYARITLATSRNPGARDAVVRDYLRRVPVGDNRDTPLIRVAAYSAPEIQDRARAESVLFFLALDDRCGAKNVHKGIARMSRLLRGQTWGLPDLRAAVEAECGGPILESFFREWMYGPEVPAEFRARYAASK